MQRVIGLMILVLLIVGCGPTPLPKAPTLLLNLDGSPAKSLTVQLVDAQGKAVAVGTSDANGKAVVRQGDGSPPPPGQYKLVIVDSDDGESNPMEQRAKAIKSRLPASYSKAATTPASVTIEDKKLDYTVELKSK